jgi:hypothetical protein
MDCNPNQPLTPPAPTPPLTVEEAKARLRAAAQDVTLGALMGGKRSWWLLGTALAAGFVSGRGRLPKIVGSVLIPMLLRVLFREKEAHSGGCSQCATSSDSSPE